MKKPLTWSYAPFRYPFDSVGDIYICRIVPRADGVSFDFLDIGAEEYTVYYRVRSCGSYTEAGKVKSSGRRDITFAVEGLTVNNEYEFYVEAGDKKSRVRLVRCGHFDCEAVVNYLHPEDEAYAFSGRYLCSPSIVRHPAVFFDKSILLDCIKIISVKELAKCYSRTFAKALNGDNL